MSNSEAGARPFYKPELDVVRLIAFIMVFFHHVLPRDPVFYSRHAPSPLLADFLTAISNSLGFGLPLFFSLSAYLITRLLILEKERSGKIHLRSFYIRRTLRIWPLFYTGIAIGLVYALLWKHHDHLKMLGFYSLFLANFYFLNNYAVENPAVPLWSLSLEEQFYLIFPLLLSIFSIRRIPYIGAAMILCSLLALFWMGNHHRDVDQYIWTRFSAHLIFFGVGVLLAFHTSQREIDLKLGMRALLFAGAIFVMIMSAFMTSAKQFGNATSGWSVVMGYMGAAAGCVLLLGAALDIKEKLPGWMIYLGKISFGLYVYHFLYLMIFKSFIGVGGWKVQPLALVPTVLTAMISYRYLEKPFLNIRKYFTFVANRPV